MAHEIERKFLIRKPTDLELFRLAQKCKTVKYEITQRYLVPGPDGAERRLRERTCVSNGTTEIFYTEKRKVSEIDREETEKKVTNYAEFNCLLKETDPELSPIVKTRYAFYFKGELFEMDIYAFSNEYAIVEIELPHEDYKFVFPPFLEQIAEVTEDKRFKNYQLAKAQKFPKI